jgi:hypothetical protein
MYPRETAGTSRKIKRNLWIGQWIYLELLKNIVRKNQSDPTPYWLQEREIHRYLGVAQGHMVKISHEVPMVVSSCKSSSVKYCLHKF